MGILEGATKIREIAKKIAIEKGITDKRHGMMLLKSTRKNMNLIKTNVWSFFITMNRLGRA